MLLGYIIPLFRPHGIQICKDFNTVFSDMLTASKAKNKEIILAGDLNCDYKKPSINKTLKDIIQVFSLKQMISSPTRITKNTQTLIDIIACSHSNNIAKAGVYLASISDHDLTGLCRKINCKRFAPRRIITRNYKNYDPENFKSDVRTIPWGNMVNHALNSVWDNFKYFLMQCINKHAPIMERSVGGRDCPWLTPDIRQHMKEREFISVRPESMERNAIGLNTVN